ncbi:hypothetical protein [Pseudoroseomonas cervicalis]|uniref:hypothetical protein n=1 Tax=Teichococcus cervicalis TaxID=204525 RepID=UPI002783E74D|nr:hypothetical protein [Pseudoroseomonas cervicalis]MDQ1080842.1 hypothetical protein [Pseudoroseomonas cervicalis]
MSDDATAGEENPGARNLAALARPMQHALNNLFMVLHANLDSVISALPPEDKTTLRLQRASQGAKDMEALLRAYLRIGRPAEQPAMDSAKYLEAVRPVLAQAAGRPVVVEVRSSTMIAPQRPAVDIALIDLAWGARELPRGVKPTLVLEGASLTAAWEAPPAALQGLEALGLSATREEGLTRVTLT